MKNIILIPYRNRQKHLDYWIKNSFPKLKKYVKNLEVLIIEQKKGKLFNRGKLLNVGYQYYNNENYNYITQDIDLNPIHLYSLYLYQKKINDNQIIGIYTSNSNTLGGIIKLNGKNFKKINGFTNNYWGWGSEDKNLQNRATFYKIIIKKIIISGSKISKIIFKIFDDIKDRIIVDKAKKN